MRQAVARWARRDHGSGPALYIMTRETNGKLLKVGRSNEPGRRVIQARRETGWNDIVLIRQFPCANPTHAEMIALTRLKDRRRARMEWFEVTLDEVLPVLRAAIVISNYVAHLERHGRPKNYDKIGRLLRLSPRLADAAGVEPAGTFEPMV